MRYLLIAFIFILLYSCLSGSENSIQRGLYYWKSDFQLNDNQNKFLDDIDAQVLYIKYFDVIKTRWSYSYFPTAELDYISDTDIPIVPVVYITPNVFYNLDGYSIRVLAENVATKIKAIHPLNKEITELQFDCDWNRDIQGSYFSFLEVIKEHFPETTISATIRLYQYKYPDITGVPPVDKGLLMYYNMGNLRMYDESNSILNNDIGRQFLGFNEYSLPLDIALPNFKWTLLFRQGNFEQICPNITLEQLKNKELFTNTRGNWYAFKKDTVLNNTYFRFGDELRFEYCSEDELLKAAELLKEEINQENTRVLIYDLQPDTPKDYEKLDAVFSAFN